MTNPVSDSLQSPVAAAALQQAPRSAVENEAKAANFQQTSRSAALNLPEDIVTLSSTQTAAKTPSQPVSPDEKRALLGADNRQYSFSVYG